jgi:chromosome segregation ATPase
LVEVFKTLERELEFTWGAALPVRAPAILAKQARRLKGWGGGAFSLPFKSVDIAGILGLVGSAEAAGLAREIVGVVERLARLEEREAALAGGAGELRERAARFDEAFVSMARVQGRCLQRVEAVERDHAAAVGDDLRQRVGVVEKGFSELKTLRQSSAQGMLQGLEDLRERISKLEVRIAEMSREARAKSGRLDALSRHVGRVEGRLTTALGGPAHPVVAVVSEMDKTVRVTG